MNDCGHSDNGGAARKTQAWRTGVALVLIVALAFILRVYRLDEQSVSWDDYNGLSGLRSPNGFAAIFMAMLFNPHSMPLYYFVQYLLSCVVGTTPVMIRGLSVFFGLLTIPLVYLIGRDVFGRKAGLFAALCLAISPVHIFHDQSIRHYALLALITTASLYALLRAVREGSPRWLAVNILLNVLACVTHFFAAAFFVTQGLFMVLFFNRHRRQTIVWVAAHCMLLSGPLFLWVLGNRGYPEAVFTHFHAPGPAQVYFDLVADDAFGAASDISFTWETWPFLSERFTILLRQFRPAADAALAGAFTLAVLWLAGRMLWRVWRRTSRDPVSRAALEQETLLLLVVFLPVLLLTAISYAVHPCIYPRYTLYSSLALYAVAGGLYQGLGYRWMRGGALAALAVLYAYQLSFLLPSTTRTNWHAAAKHLREVATPDDLILVGGSGPGCAQMALFTFHMGPSEAPVASAHTLQSVCDKSVCFFSISHKPNAKVYYIINLLYGWVSLRNLDECLSARGLVFERKEYPGEERLMLYRITPGMLFGSPSLPSPPPMIESDVDYRKALTDMGLVYTDPAKEEAAVAALRRVADGNSFPSANMFPDDWISQFLTEEGYTDMALDLARQIIKREPIAPGGYIAEATALLAKGDAPGAIVAARKAQEFNEFEAISLATLSLALLREGHPDEALSTLLATDYDGPRQYRPLLTALCRDRDPVRARAAIFKIRASNIYIPPAVLIDLGMGPGWLTPCPAPAQ